MTDQELLMVNGLARVVRDAYAALPIEAQRMFREEVGISHPEPSASTLDDIVYDDADDVVAHVEPSAERPEEEWIKQKAAEEDNALVAAGSPASGGMPDTVLDNVYSLRAENVRLVEALEEKYRQLSMIIESNMRMGQEHQSLYPLKWRVAELEVSLAQAAQDLEEKERELHTWRWLHWNHPMQSWACHCGDALGYAIDRCATCGMQKPQAPSPQETAS